MNNIDALRNQLSEQVTALKAHLTENTDEQGMLSAEAKAQADEMLGGIKDLKEQIGIIEKAEAEAKALAMRVPEPIREGIQDNGGHMDKSEYRKNFMDVMRGNIALRNTLNVGTATAGGYLVPEEWASEILKKLTENSIMRQHAQIIVTNGDYNIPVADNKSLAYWTGENVDFPETDESFSNLVLRSHKVTYLTKVTEELLHDNAYNLEGFLLDDMARKIAEKEDAAFFTGEGTDQPTGVIKSANDSGITEITADGIFDLISKLETPYLPNAKFFMAPTTLNVIRKLKDTHGQYLWQPGLNGGTSNSLAGFAVILTSAIPDGTILFGDMSYYKIAERQGFSMQVLDQLYAAQGVVGYRGFARVDGLLALPDAMYKLVVSTAAGE